MASVSCQRVPGALLSAFVKCLWYWEGAPQTHKKERLMPNGEPSIIFNLREDPIRISEDDQRRSGSYGRAVISGARTSSFVIDTAQEDRVFGIQFRAGGAFPFLRMPACEIENRTVELETLWPRTARELCERLLAATTIDAMFVLAEQYLLTALVKCAGGVGERFLTAQTPFGMTDLDGETAGSSGNPALGKTTGVIAKADS